MLFPSSLSTMSICINVSFGRLFKKACDAGQAPAAFVEELKAKGIRVSGIGHRIKSKDNRDKRVELLQNYARKVSRRCYQQRGRVVQHVPCMCQPYHVKQVISAWSCCSTAHSR